MADSDDHAVPTAAAAAPPPAPDPPTVPPQSVVDDAAPADLSRVVAKAAASAAPPPVTAAAPKRPAPATATTTTTAALSNMHKAFVGGISWHLNDADLKDSAYERKEDERRSSRALFTAHRPSVPPPLPLPEFAPFHATHASVMLDRSTNRSRGFGFVYFASSGDLDDAIKVKISRRAKRIVFFSAHARAPLPPLFPKFLLPLSPSLRPCTTPRSTAAGSP